MSTVDIGQPVDLEKFITGHPMILWNLSANQLIQHSLSLNMGELSNTGALAINTGKFTGRAPKDRFIVQDDTTHKDIDWGEINQPINDENYQKLKHGLINYLNNKKIFGRHAYACAKREFQLNITLITEYPWSNLFGYNMFLRPNDKELQNFIF